MQQFFVHHIEFNKDEIVDPVNNILVEDSINNATRWNNAGGVGILFVKEKQDYEDSIAEILSKFEIKQKEAQELEIVYATEKQKIDNFELSVDYLKYIHKYKILYLYINFYPYKLPLKQHYNIFNSYHYHQTK